MAIDPKDKEAFAVDLNGHLLQFCAPSMGWSLSPFVFQKLTEVFAYHLRDPESSTPSPSDPSATATRLRPKAFKWWRRHRRRLTRARLLPFVDDFAMFEDTCDKTLSLATAAFALLASLGLQVHPTKAHFLPIAVGDHLSMTLDFEKGSFEPLL